MSIESVLKRAIGPVVAHKRSWRGLVAVQATPDGRVRTVAATDGIRLHTADLGRGPGTGSWFATDWPGVLAAAPGDDPLRLDVLERLPFSEVPDHTTLEWTDYAPVTVSVAALRAALVERGGRRGATVHPVIWTGDRVHVPPSWCADGTEDRASIVGDGPRPEGPAVGVNPRYLLQALDAVTPARGGPRAIEIRPGRITSVGGPEGAAGMVSVTLRATLDGVAVWAGIVGFRPESLHERGDGARYTPPTSPGPNRV